MGELRAGLRAADAALFVISAGEDVDASTVALWQECVAVGTPRAVVISRLDNPRADLDNVIAACRSAFGDGVLPLYLPVRDSSGGVTGLAGLLSQRLFDYSNGYPPAEASVEDAASAVDTDELAVARNELIEGIIAEGEDIEADVLINDLETAVTRGTFHPVIPACAHTGVGLAEILEVITRALPAPVQRTAPEAVRPDGSPHPAVAVDPAAPLVAEVVRTTVDPYQGRVSLVRVFSGTLRPDGPVHVSGHGLAERGHADHDVDERVSHIYSPLGGTLNEVPYCIAGDLCAVTKLSSAETGDTLSAPNDPLLVQPWMMPEPLLPVAVVGRSRSDEDALARGLGRLVAADPTLRLERNAETKQMVLWTMGEAHADVVLSRLRAGGAEVDTEPVVIPLRQTFAGASKGHGRHVKQSGGHGQYAVCDIEVEPLPRGSGFEFVDKVVGGAIPNQFIPSVEKGVRAQMERGLSPRGPARHGRRRQSAQRRLLRCGVPDRWLAGAQRRSGEGQHRHARTDRRRGGADARRTPGHRAGRPVWPARSGAGDRDRSGRPDAGPRRSARSRTAPLRSRPARIDVGNCRVYPAFFTLCPRAVQFEPVSRQRGFDNLEVVRQRRCTGQV